jgi:hypothetical protein
MVMSLLGAGHLETTGLRHGLLLGCGLGVAPRFSPLSSRLTHQSKKPSRFHLG